MTSLYNETAGNNDPSRYMFITHGLCQENQGFYILRLEEEDRISCSTMSIGLYINNDIMIHLQYLRYLNVILSPDLLDVFFSIVEKTNVLKDNVFNIVGITDDGLQRLRNKFPFVLIEKIGSTSSAHLLNNLVSHIDSSQESLHSW